MKCSNLFVYSLSLNASHPSLHSQAGQANISEEQLVDRLMDIVGHLVQRKTLKVRSYSLEYYPIFYFIICFDELIPFMFEICLLIRMYEVSIVN